MRVTFLQDHLRSGGTERQTLAIAQGLANKGVDTHVIVFRKGGVLDAQARNADFTLRFLKQGPLTTDWFAPGLKRLLDEIAPNAVIPMGRMANCHAGLLCGSSNRSYKIIATFRSGRSLPRLQKKALKQADHIVTNSKDALQRLARLHRIHRPDTSAVIYNGCLRDFDLFIPSHAPASSTSSSSSFDQASTFNSPSTRRPAPSTQKAIHLCSISMFRPQKKQERLIQLCSRLPDDIAWKLTLAGDGPRLKTCQKEAQRLKVADHVEFPGLLKDPHSLYQAADLALHASAQESLPNFLIEAQTAGLPVIAYDIDGVSETFVHEKSGYLIPHLDETHFLEKLEQLCRDAAKREGMSKEAIRFARSRFAMETQISSYLSLLANLLKT